ncbi:UV excision repair protein RAD23 homolog A [Drosophila sulfurigaster albostrigata]|uniref:UV excision repair protein RAD23 homolog A n=1 Tax=Drosophila sulfurigaster albostrigata TaxID=89887 RepID=UPI002D218A43|nr:UV excision repair protein RAD23 homolog A [Drosophila sulfurigaster albostrigata]
MKLSIRTLDQRTISLELVDDSQNVLQLKQRLVQLPEIKHPVEQLQLIYAGRIMEDEQPLKQYNIVENKFIVLMTKRGEAEQQKLKEEIKESKTESQVVSKGEPIAESKGEPIADSKEVSTPQSEQPPLPVVTPPSLTHNEQLVRNLMDMGYEEQQVRAALRASFNHPERAIEYLISGIPSTEVERSSPAAATPAPTPAPAPDGSSDSTAERLQHLAADPRFAHVRDMIRQNPQLLEVVLAHLSESAPHTFEAIRSHQDEFIAMLNAAPGEDAAATQLTSEEEAAVERLMALGFDRATVLQVYVACDKNEELTADILFSQTDEEDED